MRNTAVGIGLTLVDQFQLGDDVQTNIGKLVFEHLEKHGKEVGNGPATSQQSLINEEFAIHTRLSRGLVLAH